MGQATVFGFINSLGALFGTVVGGAIGALLGALILKPATKWVAGFVPSYGMAYRASFFSYLVADLTGFVVGLVVISTGYMSLGRGMLLALLVSIVPTSIVAGRVLKHPDTGSIGLENGFLILLVQTMLGVALVVVVVSFLSFIGILQGFHEVLFAN